MILSVGTRTDIVTHYGAWLMERFRQGYVYQRNPMFPNHVTRYDLAPEKIDAIYFCSKNYLPFLAYIPQICKQYRTLFHYTVNAYGTDIEPNVPTLDERIDTFLRLASLVGRDKVVWRYDPVLLTPDYPAERHLDAFEQIARSLSGRTNRCIFGFVETHMTIRSSIPDLEPLTLSAKAQLAEGFAKIAKRYSFSLQMCRGSLTYEQYGIDVNGCVRLDLLGKMYGCEFRDIKHKGNRRWCRCIESRDIGAYESCPTLCKYCFASTDADKVHANRLLHDVSSPLLIGQVGESDTVVQGVQDSYLKPSVNRQISLFD